MEVKTVKNKKKLKFYKSTTFSSNSLAVHTDRKLNAKLLKLTVRIQLENELNRPDLPSLFQSLKEQVFLGIVQVKSGV